jgi:hypothetical protein
VKTRFDNRFSLAWRGRVVRLGLFAAVLTLLVLRLSSLPVSAASDSVTTCANSGAGSLPVVVASAAPGDTIGFAQDCTGTDAIILADSISITKDLSIDGMGHSVTVDGGNAVRVFMIGRAIAVRLDGLTIQHGNAADNTDGGGIRNIGALTLSNSTLRDNRASSHGGGIYNGPSGTLTVRYCTLSGNAGGSGGIYNLGTLEVTDSTLAGNSADLGGGILNAAGTVTVTNSTLTGNAARFVGGGIANTGTLTVTDSTLSGNSVTGLSGIPIQTGGAPLYSGGGGLFNGHGTLTLVNTIVAGNSATGGATDPDIGGTVDTANSHNNLIGDASSSGGLTNGTNGNIIGVASLGFGAFGGNGDPTLDAGASGGVW